MLSPEKVVPITDEALCIKCDNKAERDALIATFTKMDHWVNVIPGAFDVTVQYDPMQETRSEAVKRVLKAIKIEQNRAEIPDKTLTIPVCYQSRYAPDMTFVCDTLGLSAEEVVTRHSQASYRVDMIGFTPGFAYLEEGDPGLDIPRLPTPRTHVAAGSVGLAGGRCGLYALDGPGGWPIVGCTPKLLFDPKAEDQFLLSPGMKIRFSPISEAEFESWMT